MFIPDLLVSGRPPGASAEGKHGRCTGPRCPFVGALAR